MKHCFGDLPRAAGLLIGCSLLAAGTTRADTLLFSYQSSDASASWEQSSNPATFDVRSTSFGVYVQDGTETVSAFGTDSFPYVSFLTGSVGGGFSTQTGEVITSGAVLFTGTESAPIFSAGIYDLTDDDSGGQPVTGVLTVTDQSVAVPEPASVAIFGVGLLGVALVRSRRIRPREI